MTCLGIPGCIQVNALAFGVHSVRMAALCCDCLVLWHDVPRVSQSHASTICSTFTCELVSHKAFT